MFIQQKSDILSLGYFHEEIHIAKFTCQYKKKRMWKWKSFSPVQIFVTPWTIQSTEFSGQETG